MLAALVFAAGLVAPTAQAAPCPHAEGPTNTANASPGDGGHVGHRATAPLDTLPPTAGSAWHCNGICGCPSIYYLTTRRESATVSPQGGDDLGDAEPPDRVVAMPPPPVTDRLLPQTGLALTGRSPSTRPADVFLLSRRLRI